MATYYGVKGSSNWTSGNWSTTATKDASRTGSGVSPTSSDDCILDDWTSDGGGVTWTVNAANAACKNLTCTGYAGTLTFGAGNTLACTGSPTFDNTMTLSGTGTLRINTTATITMDGMTFPGSILLAGSSTYTLPEALVITGTLTIGGTTAVMAGAFDITCATFATAGTSSFTLVSGQTLTVSTAMNLSTYQFGSLTIKASLTDSTKAALTFSGLASACKVAGVTFIDIDASGSAQGIDNWHGSTTRTTNITNRTSADIGGGSGGAAAMFRGMTKL